MKLITSAQRKKIYAMSHRLRWTNEILHTFLKAKFLKEHISDLTRFESFKFINTLQKILDDGHEPVFFPDDPQLIACTPRQCQEIRNLAEEIGWTEGKITDYIEQWGAKRLESLTQTLANELIKKLRADQRTLRACPGRR